jgi:hypothetical protein
MTGAEYSKGRHCSSFHAKKRDKGLFINIFQRAFELLKKIHVLCELFLESK